MSLQRSRLGASLGVGVLLLVCMVSLLPFERRSTSTILASRDDKSDLSHARQVDETLKKGIQQVQLIQAKMSTEIVGGDMAQVLRNGGKRRISYLREMATDAEKLKQLTSQAAKQSVAVLVASAKAEAQGCQDNHQQMCGKESCCSFWSRKGECSASNQAWMTVECTMSCSLCTPSGAGTNKLSVSTGANMNVIHSVSPPSQHHLDKINWPEAGEHVFADDSGLAWPSPGQEHVQHKSAAQHLDKKVHVAPAAAANMAPKRLSTVHVTSLARTSNAAHTRGRHAESVRTQEEGRADDAQDERRPEVVGGEKRPARIEVSVTLHGVPQGSLGRDKIEEALRAAVASVGHGISPKDVGIDSITGAAGAKRDPDGNNRAVAAASHVKGQLAQLRQHVYGTAHPITPSDAFFGGAFDSRRRLLSIPSMQSKDATAAASHDGDVSVRFHLVVPQGINRRVLISSLKANLRARINAELSTRGVHPRLVSLGSISHVPRATSTPHVPHMHEADRTLEQEKGFGAWAKRYLLGGFAGAAHSRGRRMKLAQMQEQDDDEEDRHKVSGLERVPFAPAPRLRPQIPSVDHGLDLLTKGSDEYLRARAPSKDKNDPENWEFESESPPDKVADVQVPEDVECGPACQERKAAAEANDVSSETDKARVAREHVIEDANTLKHLLDAVSEEEKLLHERSEEDSASTDNDKLSASTTTSDSNGETSAAKARLQTLAAIPRPPGYFGNTHNKGGDVTAHHHRDAAQVSKKAAGQSEAGDMKKEMLENAKARELEKRSKEQAEIAALDEKEAKKLKIVAQLAADKEAEAQQKEGEAKQEEKKKETEEEKKEETTPVNVQVHANIDSPKGNNFPEWYRKELAERKADGADRNTFDLDLGINVASPQGSTQATAEASTATTSDDVAAAAAGGDAEQQAQAGGQAVQETKAKVQSLYEKADDLVGGHVVGGDAKDADQSSVRAARGMQQVKKGESLEQRLRAEERDADLAMARIRRLTRTV